MSVQVLRPMSMNTQPGAGDFRYAPPDFSFAPQDIQNQPPVDAFFGAAAVQYPYANAMMERPTSGGHFDTYAGATNGSFGSYAQAADQKLYPTGSRPMALGQAPRSVSTNDVGARRRSPVSHPYSVSPHDFQSTPPLKAPSRSEDEEKKARRKEQNRLAQQDLRKRRMEHAQFLEGRVAELSRQLEQQNGQIAMLRSQNEQIHDAYQKMSGRPFEFSPPLNLPMSFQATDPRMGFAQGGVIGPMATTPPDSADSMVSQQSRRESMTYFTTSEAQPPSSSNSVHGYDISPGTPYGQMSSQLQPSPQGPLRSSPANHVSIGFMLGGPQGRRPSPPQLLFGDGSQQMAYSH